MNRSLQTFLKTVVFVALLALIWHLGAPQRSEAQDLEALVRQFNDNFSAAVEADEAQNLQKALPHWEKAWQALSQFEESEDIAPFLETVLFKLGETNRMLGQRVKAPEGGDDKTRAEAQKLQDSYFDDAAKAFDILAGRKELAAYERDDVLMQQGFLESAWGKALEERGVFDKARAAQEKALTHFKAVKDEARGKDAVARELSAHSRTLKALGRYNEALVAVQKALDHWLAVNDAVEVRRERGALAAVQLTMGEVVQAAETLRALLDSAPQGPEGVDLVQAAAAFNLGICLQILGEYQRAGESLEQAMAMAETVGDTELLQSIRNSQGILAYDLGIYTDALHLFEDAAKTHDRQLRAKALLNTVAAYIAQLQETFDQADFDAADAAADASIALARDMGDPRTELAAVQNKGRLHFERLGDPEVKDDALREPLAKAFSLLAEALALAEKLQDQGAATYELSDIANNLGDACLEIDARRLEPMPEATKVCPEGDFRTCAFAFYRQAEGNAKNIKAMDQLWQARHGMGKARRAMGNLDQAEQHFIQAIEIIESMRDVLGAGDAAGFLRNRSEPYTDLIDLLLQRWKQGKDSPQAGDWSAKALEYLERSRQAAIKSLFEQALPQEKQEQGRRLAEIQYRLQRLQLSPVANKEAIADLEAERGQMEKLLEADDPFLRPPGVDLAKVRASLGPDRTVLAFYYDADDIYIWELHQDGLALHSAPRATGAGRRVRDFFTEYVAQFGSALAENRDVTGLLAEFYRKLFLDSGLDLPSPDDPGGRELVLIPYGALAGVPFGAMLTAREGGHYLMERYTVSYVASLGQLLVKPVATAGDLVAVGNPVMPSYFGAALPPADEGARGGAMGMGVIPYIEAATIHKLLNPADYAPTVQETEGTRAFGFNSLPSAGEEVRHIETTASGQGGQPVTVADATVTETELFDMLTQEPRGYVHLATHGKLLPRSPLDSFLVFSEDSTAEGDYRSGLVTVRQIRRDLFGKLAGARLCTLSCCETALRGGNLGLELASLASAFQSAGAGMVVASLWEVPSKATAVLMARFYDLLFAGAGIPQALREAQLEMAKSEAYAAPLNWAAFIPIGVDVGQEDAALGPQGAGQGVQ